MAQANSIDSSPMLFGLVYINDDPLTIDPELSELIGCAQGITASASVEELILFKPFTSVFTNKAYNGSTPSVAGQHPYAT
ncbi:UNVERIFIED_CONTAM: hypothetical protein Sindi_1379800 [Sesamum indicum]